MKVENLTNAFVKVTGAVGHVVCDPWITDGIYDGSWNIWPPLRTHESALSGARAAIITHIHQDHMDVEALKLLPDNSLIYVPDVYPNRQVISRRLPMKDRVRYVNLSEPFCLDDMQIEFVPPMNRFGHRLDLYDEPLETAAIDSGIIISSIDGKIVLLADNFPYHPKSAGASLERMLACDALFFPYNACADDYPVCFDNFSCELKREKSLARNTARLKQMGEFISLIKPGITVPYSSDFTICGDRYEEFMAVHPRAFLDKVENANLVKELTGVPCTALFEGDELRVSRTCEISRGNNRSVAPPSRHTRPKVVHPSVGSEALTRLFIAAAEHMLSKMKVCSTWRLELHSTDSDFAMSVDLSTGMIDRCDPTQPVQNNTLRCGTLSWYLHSLLSFRTHWDNAMISYNLSWQRNPDTYDLGIYRALNHLHEPIGKP